MGRTSTTEKTRQWWHSRLHEPPEHDAALLNGRKTLERLEVMLLGPAEYDCLEGEVLMH